MAAPYFDAQSTGLTDAGGSWTFSSDHPNTGTQHPLVILQILQDGPTANAISAVAWNGNVYALDGTGSSMTYLGQFPVGGSSEAFQYLWIGRPSYGPTDFIITTGSNSTSEDLYARYYYFLEVSDGTTLATVIENVTAGATVNSAGTGTPADVTDVTTLGPDRLVLNLLAVNDDNITGAPSGTTGGHWRPTITYAESSGTDGAISLYQAYGDPSTGIGDDYAGTSQAIYGYGSTAEKRALAFHAIADVTGGQIYLKKTGNPTDSLTLSIQAVGGGGEPSGTMLGSTSIAASAINASGFTWVPFTLSATCTPGDTYFLVIQRTGGFDASNYFELNTTTQTATDLYAWIQNDGTWSETALKEAFGLYPNHGTVSGGTISITDPDAWGNVGFALIGTTVSGPSNFQQTAADALSSLAEATARAAAARSRTLAEAVSSLSEATAALKMKMATAADALGSLSEAAARSVAGKVRTLAEQVSSAAEAPARIAGLKRAGADTITSATEAAVRVMGKARTIADALASATESAARAAGSRARTTADTVGSATEAVAKVAAHARTLADTAGAFAEATARRITGIRVVAETVGAISEAPARVAGMLRSGADALATLASAVVGIKTSGSTQYVADAADALVSLTEATARAAGARARDVAEAVASLVEAPVRVGARIRTTADSVTSAAEAVVRSAGARARTAGDALASASEAATRSAAARARTVADAVGSLAESAASIRTMIRTSADAIASATEAAARGTAAWSRTAADTVVSAAEAIVRAGISFIRREHRPSD